MTRIVAASTGCVETLRGLSGRLWAGRMCPSRNGLARPLSRADSLLEEPGTTRNALARGGFAHGATLLLGEASSHSRKARAIAPRDVDRVLDPGGQQYEPGLNGSLRSFSPGIAFAMAAWAHVVGSMGGPGCPI